MSSHIIEFYFDFASPYAYLAAQKIEELGERFDHDIIWKPMLLGANGRSAFDLHSFEGRIQHPRYEPHGPLYESAISPSRRISTHDDGGGPSFLLD